MLALAPPQSGCRTYVSVTALAMKSTGWAQEVVMGSVWSGSNCGAAGDSRTSSDSIGQTLTSRLSGLVESLNIFF